jgi:hypothetical protein
LGNSRCCIGARRRWSNRQRIEFSWFLRQIHPLNLSPTRNAALIVLVDGIRITAHGSTLRRSV